MGAVISVKNLVKEYIIEKPSRRMFPFNVLFRESMTKRAVDDISFTIHEGEFVGYIGPNGAGKSTSIKVLTGILSPTAGEVSVLGLRPDRERVRNARNIGVLFGQRTQLWWDLPLRDSFEILKAIYEVPDASYRRNLDFFRTQLDLEQYWATPVRQLSLGERMRAEMCAAIVHSPKILFLDEPTIGLDVVAKEKVRRFLTDLNREQKVTILLTTHDIGDIERLCQRLVLINNGRILWDDTLDSLRGTTVSHSVLVFEVTDFDRALKLERGQVLREQGARKWVAYNSERYNLGDVIAEVAQTHRVVNVRSEEESIEDIIRDMYEHGNLANGGRSRGNTVV